MKKLNKFYMLRVKDKPHPLPSIHETLKDAEVHRFCHSQYEHDELEVLSVRVSMLGQFWIWLRRFVARRRRKR